MDYVQWQHFVITIVIICATQPDKNRHEYNIIYHFSSCKYEKFGFGFIVISSYRLEIKEETSAMHKYAFRLYILMIKTHLMDWLECGESDGWLIYKANIWNHLFYDWGKVNLILFKNRYWNILKWHYTNLFFVLYVIKVILAHTITVHMWWVIFCL